MKLIVRVFAPIVLALVAAFIVAPTGSAATGWQVICNWPGNDGKPVQEPAMAPPMNDVSVDGALIKVRPVTNIPLGESLDSYWGAYSEQCGVAPGDIVVVGTIDQPFQVFYGSRYPNIGWALEMVIEDYQYRAEAENGGVANMAADLDSLLYNIMWVLEHNQGFEQWDPSNHVTEAVPPGLHTQPVLGGDTVNTMIADPDAPAEPQHHGITKNQVVGAIAGTFLLVALVVAVVRYVDPRRLPPSIRRFLR